MLSNIVTAALFLGPIVATSPALGGYLESDVTAVDQYTAYSGNGSVEAGWPSETQWASFDQLWAVNTPLMQKSCGWNRWGADNSQEEIDNIGSAIKQVSRETSVDSRFILAIVMQESKGCVRVITTNNGINNPGLMQSHDGSGTCVGVNPCPQSSITLMIQDGVSGTKNGSGPGLQQLLPRALSELKDGTTSDSRTMYVAARLYNSGSVNTSNLNVDYAATACYASDVANRLTGWTLAPAKCKPE